MELRQLEYFRQIADTHSFNGVTPGTRTLGATARSGIRFPIF